MESSIICQIVSIFITVAAILAATTTRPMYAVFWLVSAYIGAAIFIIALGFSYLGLILAIVYTGAVTILFVFAVMLIPQIGGDSSRDKSQFSPLIILIVISLGPVLEIASSLSGFIKEGFIGSKSNIQALSIEMYSTFQDLILISAGILILAMVVAILIVEQPNNTSSVKASDLEDSALGADNESFTDSYKVMYKKEDNYTYAPEINKSNTKRLPRGLDAALEILGSEGLAGGASRTSKKPAKAEPTKKAPHKRAQKAPLKSELIQEVDLLMQEKKIRDTKLIQAQDELRAAELIIAQHALKEEELLTQIALLREKLTKAEEELTVANNTITQQTLEAKLLRDAELIKAQEELKATELLKAQEALKELEPSVISPASEVVVEATDSNDPIDTEAPIDSSTIYAPIDPETFLTPRVRYEFVVQHILKEEVGMISHTPEFVKEKFDKNRLCWMRTTLVETVPVTTKRMRQFYCEDSELPKMLDLDKIDAHFEAQRGPRALMVTHKYPRPANYVMLPIVHIINEMVIGMLQAWKKLLLLPELVNNTSSWQEAWALGDTISPKPSQVFITTIQNAIDNLKAYKEPCTAIIVYTEAPKALMLVKPILASETPPTNKPAGFIIAPRDYTFEEYLSAFYPETLEAINKAPLPWIKEELPDLMPTDTLLDEHIRLLITTANTASGFVGFDGVVLTVRELLRKDALEQMEVAKVILYREFLEEELPIPMPRYLKEAIDKHIEAATLAQDPSSPLASTTLEGIRLHESQTTKPLGPFNPITPILSNTNTPLASEDYQVYVTSNKFDVEFNEYSDQSSVVFDPVGASVVGEVLSPVEEKFLVDIISNDLGDSPHAEQTNTNLNTSTNNITETELIDTTNSPNINTEDTSSLDTSNTENFSAAKIMEASYMNRINAKDYDIDDIEESLETVTVKTNTLDMEGPGAQFVTLAELESIFVKMGTGSEDVELQSVIEETVSPTESSAQTKSYYSVTDKELCPPVELLTPEELISWEAANIRADLIRQLAEDKQLEEVLDVRELDSIPTQAQLELILARIKFMEENSPTVYLTKLIKWVAKVFGVQILLNKEELEARTLSCRTDLYYNSKLWKRLPKFPAYGLTQ